MSHRKKAHPYSDEGSFPILADFHEAEDSLAFERTSGKRNLKNPSGSCTTPHEEGGKGSGDGTCYQRHREHNAQGVSGGLPPAGENGSAQRAEYMRKYRKTKGERRYDGRDVPSNEGKWTRESGPVDGVNTPRKETVPRPFGKTHDRGSEKRASADLRIASLELELLEEQMNLMRLASEHPQLRQEVANILKQAFRRPYKKNVNSQTFTTSKGTKKQYKKRKNLLNPRKSLSCMTQWEEWSDSDWEAYVKELWANKDNVHGECYQIHNDWGKWKGKSRGSDKEYQDWYNNNVRQYGPKGVYKGPASSSKKRTKKNRKEMVDANVSEKMIKKFYTFLMKHIPENMKRNQEVVQQIDESQQVALKTKKLNLGLINRLKNNTTPKTTETNTTPKTTETNTTPKTTETNTTPKKKPRGPRRDQTK